MLMLICPAGTIASAEADRPMDEAIAQRYPPMCPKAKKDTLSRH